MNFREVWTRFLTKTTFTTNHLIAMDTMTTLSEILNKLNKEGYTEDFNLIECTTPQKLDSLAGLVK